MGSARDGPSVRIKMRVAHIQVLIMVSLGCLSLVILDVSLALAFKGAGSTELLEEDSLIPKSEFNSRFDDVEDLAERTAWHLYEANMTAAGRKVPAVRQKHDKAVTRRKGKAKTNKKTSKV